MLLFRQTEQPALVDSVPLARPGDYSRLRELDCSESAKNLRERRLWMYGKPNGAFSKLHFKDKDFFDVDIAMSFVRSIS